MFEKALSLKFKKIFAAKKVTYWEKSDSREQETLFIDIQTSKAKAVGQEFTAKVEGRAFMFGSNEKLPYGYFLKSLQEADPVDTNDLFAFDFETNSNQYEDIVERGFSFVYFYNSQYDPDAGSITSISMETN